MLHLCCAKPPLEAREACQLRVEEEFNGVDWSVAMLRDDDLRYVVHIFGALRPSGKFCVIAIIRFTHRVVVLLPKDEQHDICVLLYGAAIPQVG